MEHNANKMTYFQKIIINDHSIQKKLCSKCDQIKNNKYNNNVDFHINCYRFYVARTTFQSYLTQTEHNAIKMTYFQKVIIPLRRLLTTLANTYTMFCDKPSFK